MVKEEKGKWPVSMAMAWRIEEMTEDIMGREKKLSHKISGIHRVIRSLEATDAFKKEK